MSDAAKYANAFADVFQQAADAVLEEKQNAEDRIADLESQRAEIDTEIERLRSQLEEVENNIAVGLRHAAKGAGIKLELKQKMNGGAPPVVTGSGGKAPDAVLAKVLSIVPLGRQHASTFGAISKSVDIADGKEIAKVLKRLAAEKKVKTIGERRGKRYFRE